MQKTMCSDVHKNFTLKFRDIFVNTMQTVTATVTAAADEQCIEHYKIFASEMQPARQKPVSYTVCCNAAHALIS